MSATAASCSSCPKAAGAMNALAGSAEGGGWNPGCETRASNTGGASWAPHCPGELQGPLPPLSLLRECREDAPVVSILSILWTTHLLTSLSQQIIRSSWGLLSDFYPSGLYILSEPSSQGCRACCIFHPGGAFGSWVLAYLYSAQALLFS